jgi:LacI family transcriptional regulator
MEREFMITIKEMANMLGLSTTTVSNVIHGKTKEVSQETIDKVNKLLEEYDYVPNINARNLASNKSRLVGVGIIAKKNYKNYLKDPFASEVIGAIERELKKNGYYLMAYFSDDAQEVIHTVTSWNVDGMILIGMRQEDCELFQKKYKKPQVYIDSQLSGVTFHGVNIGLEDKKGGYLLARHLIEQGHRNILFLADNFQGIDYARYCGFEEAMKEAGYPFSKDNNFMKIDSGEEELEKSLDEVYKVWNRYTALFAASDFYALRIINKLWDNGIKVPEDVSVVGFDDNMYAKMARPSITTVHQNPTRKGELAVEYLMRQLGGETMVDINIDLPVELIVRDTVKKLG